MSNPVGWARTTPGNKDEPKEVKKDKGWNPKEPAGAQFMNWWQGAIGDKFAPELLDDADQSLTIIQAFRMLIINPIVDRVLTLPSVDIEAGFVYEIYNIATDQDVILKSFDSDIIWAFKGRLLSVIALQDAPTDRTHWRILIGQFGIIDSQYITVGNVGAGEDDLMSFTLPANALDADGKGLRIKAFGAGNTVDNATLKFHFGGESATLAGGATVQTWSVDVILIRDGSSSQRYSYLGNRGSTMFFNVLAETASETDTAAIVIKFTGENTSDASDDAVTQQGMVIELFEVK